MELVQNGNRKHCIEKNIELYDVINSDEAFMTGTPFCMLPVTSINSIKIGNGKRGPITDNLLTQWSKNVEVDIESQIKNYNLEDKNKKQDGPTPYRFTKEEN